MTARSIVITVAYNGSGFAGFARQPGQLTVQGSLEAALATALRSEVEIVGAGRTDAGVHALAQVVSFSFDGEIDTSALLKSLNALTGPGIVVSEVREATRGFSARFDAMAREYRYRIVPGPIPPVFLAEHAWWVKPSLDISAMRDASSLLIGEHDFGSFCVAASAEGKPTKRRLELVSIEPAVELGEHCLVIRIVGNAFLHSMVRVIVGSLVEVGSGRRGPEWIGQALLACDRTAAGPTAPAHGLTLWHVDYAQECWL